MSKKAETVTYKIESHYAKQPDGFVYYYWRIVGSNSWNVQKTAMKNVPTKKMVMDIRNKVVTDSTIHPSLRMNYDN